MSLYKLKHTPGYFQFYVQDPEHFVNKYTTDKDVARRYMVSEGMVAVFVISEFTEIAIDLELFSTTPIEQDFAAWDKVVEFPLLVRSKEIVLCGCPDGPRYGRFAAVDVTPGSYRLRVSYGGQDTRQIDGSSADFYRVQLWPDTDKSVRLLKE